jgi:RNA recognition motif-containing protein
VDFKDIQSATNALTNPRNHSLNGRALVVEYATADAVRRGQIKAKNAQGESKPRSSRRPQKSERIAAKAAARLPRLRQSSQSLTEPQLAKLPTEGENNNNDGSNEGKEHLVSDKKSGKRQERRSAHVGKPIRSKPGAALATARRENVAIVQSTGNKITFTD